MFYPSSHQEVSRSFLKREAQTSQPRFKRLIKVNSPEGDLKSTTQSNFPLLNRGNAFDNSKENLYYETHLTKVRSACKLDETTIVSKYLNAIRKDYDGMSKVSKRELTSMKLKKREIDFMKMKNKVFTEKREELEQKITEKERQTDHIKSQYEDAKMQTKTLENIITRMKKDEIFYKQFGRIKDQELKKKMKQVKSLDQNIIHEEQKLHKLMNSLNDCKNLYNKNKQLREKKYEDFSGKISDVKQRDKFIQQRKQRTYELQSIELNDTLDEKNIHMREIILAHKVADSLLQSKVNCLIKKYAETQGAFHLVKVKTGVSEPQLLTSKFFSYEQTSQSLLETINQNERRIQELIHKRQKLTKIHKNLITENLSINDSKNGLQFDNILLKKETVIRDINEKHLMVDQITNWIDKKLLDFHPEEYQKQLPVEVKLQMLCRLLTENIKKYEHYELNDKKVHTMGVRMKKILKELSAQQLSLRIRESQEMNQSNIIEEQFIKTSRQNVMKKAFSIKHLKRQSATNNNTPNNSNK